MRVLFYASRTPNVSVMLDEAICLCNEGHQVFFIYNDCATKICQTNLSQYSVECKMCHRRWIKAIRLLPRKISKYNLTEFWDDSHNYKFVYETVKDIKEIEYKNVKVGYAVLSSYFSVTRNLNPLINDSSKQFFDKLICATCKITDALERAISKIRPDKIYFWNSRYFDSRPAFDMAKYYKIESVSIERTNDEGQKNVKTRFVNHTPHDILYQDELHKTIWENAPYSYEEKIQIGKSFFEKRRNGIAAGDKVYVGNQQLGLLPQNWNQYKRNIVIFNSSEDEFAALGDEFETLALFPTQYKGIVFILEALKDEPSIHVYLRIHPNLANIQYRYHVELINLTQKYKNLTVINAKDSISTYTLMDAAEKVVVFGSSMGLESAYCGKPVILLAAAKYYYSDICYVPRSKEELKKLLTSSLVSKDNVEAIKWGFYILYRNPADYARYVDIDQNWFHVGKRRWLDIHYLKLLGSSRLNAIYSELLSRLYKRHSTCCYIPAEEDTNAEL